MRHITQLLLIFAIIITALFGLGFGLCGVVGLVMGVQASAANASSDGLTLILPLSLAGIGVAVGAGFFIYQVLWKAYRRRSRGDG